MAAYPDIIVDVRGRGLMVGVEFRRFLDDPSFLLRLLTNQDDLVFVLVGYLFNVHRIRVAPTLSDPQTLRLEPSLPDFRRGHRSLSGRAGGRLREAAGARCRRADPLLHRGRSDRRDRDHARHLRHEVLHLRRAAVLAARAEPAAAEGRVAVPHDRRRRSRHRSRRTPPVCRFDEREQFLRHFAPRANPIVMSSFDVQSIAGATVRFYAIVLPFTSNADEGVAGRRRTSSASATRSTRRSRSRASSGVTSSRSANTPRS